MLSMCFVFWVRSNYFVISLSPSQGGFPTCPSSLCYARSLRTFCNYYPFLSSQGKGLHCEFQYPAAQYSCTWGNSVHWAIIECLCNSVFRCCWLLDSREICVFIIYIYVCIYLCLCIPFLYVQGHLEAQNKAWFPLRGFLQGEQVKLVPGQDPSESCGLLSRHSAEADEMLRSLSVLAFLFPSWWSVHSPNQGLMLCWESCI